MASAPQQKPRAPSGLSWFVGGNLVSLAGNTLFDAAIFWYLSLHNGPVVLSIFAAAVSAPRALSTVVGVFADGRNPRTMMILTRVAEAGVVLGMEPIIRQTPGIVFALFLLGMLATVDSLTGVTWTSANVTADSRARLIGWLHTAQAGLQMLGRASGALLLSLIRPVGILEADAASFLAAALSAIRLRGVPQKQKYNPDPAAFRHRWAAGWGALRRDSMSVRLLIGIGGIATFTVPIQAFLAIWLHRHFHATAWWFGAVYAAEMGGGIVGGVIGSRVTTWVIRRRGFHTVMLIDLILFGACTVAVVWSPSLWLEIGIMAVLGLIQAFQNITAPTYVMQTHPPALLGRIVGTITSTEAILRTGVSAILAGSMLVLSIRDVFIGCGISMVLLAMVLFSRKPISGIEQINTTP